MSTPKDLILLCPVCQSGSVMWCQISVRPYCTDCGNWAPVNFGSAEEAVDRWNARVKQIFTKEELDYYLNAKYAA